MLPSVRTSWRAMPVHILIMYLFAITTSFFQCNHWWPSASQRIYDRWRTSVETPPWLQETCEFTVKSLLNEDCAIRVAMASFLTIKAKQKCEWCACHFNNRVSLQQTGAEFGLFFSSEFFQTLGLGTLISGRDTLPFLLSTLALN